MEQTTMSGCYSYYGIPLCRVTVEAIKSEGSSDFGTLLYCYRLESTGTSFMALSGTERECHQNSGYLLRIFLSMSMSFFLFFPSRNTVFIVLPFERKS